jgi:hypothetical protein
LEAGGIWFGQGRKKIPPQPGLTLPALAVIGKAATRTAAIARVPSTFFMTFSFFKTVFVSNRFSFFVSELPNGDCNACARFAARAKSRRHDRAAARAVWPSVLRKKS